MSGSDPLSNGLPTTPYSRSSGTVLPRRLSGASQTSSISLNNNADSIQSHPLSSSPAVSSSITNSKYAVYSPKRDPQKTTNSSNTSEETLTIIKTTTSSPKAPFTLSKASTTSTLGIGNPISRTETSSTLPPPPPRRTMSEASVSLVSQNLKAELQKLGLSNESAGAVLVNKLSNLGREPEWRGIFAAIGSGKITLLLPRERMLENTILPPTFFLDHLIIIDPPMASTSSTLSTSPRGFATLSGFRGTIDSDGMIFASCGSLLAESSSGLLKSGSLHPPNLADVHLHSAISGSAYPSMFTTNSPSPFPSIRLLSPITDISIPRLLSIAADRRKEALGRQASSTGSRLAALFAKTPPSTPPPPQLTPSDTLSDVSSPSDLLPSKPNYSEPAYSESIPSKTSFLEVPVSAIEKTIRHSEIIKSISGSLDSYLKKNLSGKIEGIDSTTGRKIRSFISKFHPPESWLNAFPPSGGRTLSESSAFGKSIEEVADSIQDLFHTIRDDISINLRQKSKKGRSDEEDLVPIPMMTTEEHNALEQRIDESLEQVEELILTVLYDRIFSPATSSDSQEDENLASRIAALNLLNLSLEHLGLDLGGGGTSDRWDEGSRTLRDSIEDIIGVAGKELSRLQDPSIRSPRAKINIFVNLHKLIVDELSRLPPIPFKDSKPDVEALAGRKRLEVEMDGTSNRSTSRASSNQESVISFARDESPSRELASSVHDATNSSFFDPDPEPESVVPFVEPINIVTSSTSKLTIETKPSTSSADLILPLLIYVVVKYNQPLLYSNLLYVQRFRSDSLMRGEGAYCSTNIHAVIEFLNTVDMGALGLSSQNLFNDSSTEALSSTAEASSSSASKIGSPLKSKLLVGVSSRVTKENLSQELDSLVDTANVALFHSINSMRSLFSPQGIPKTLEDVKQVLDGAGGIASKAKGTLLRRGTGNGSGNEGVQREMLDIAPGSELLAEDDDGKYLEGKLSIADRLAGLRFGNTSEVKVSPTAGSSTPTTTKSSLFSFGPKPVSITASTPPASIHSISATTSLKPIAKFMQCQVEDLTMREVAELLADYKRLGGLVSGEE